VQGLPSLQAHARPFGFDMHAEAAQHALGVVARGRGLGDRGDAFGVQAGEQDGGLHLGAGHRQRVVDAVQRSHGPYRDGRLAVGGEDIRAHLAQRLRDALHGA